MYADHRFEQSPITITKKRRYAAELPIMPFMAQQPLSVAAFFI
jgi:hypothetical protein